MKQTIKHILEAAPTKEPTAWYGHIGPSPDSPKIIHPFRLNIFTTDPLGTVNEFLYAYYWGERATRKPNTGSLAPYTTGEIVKLYPNAVAVISNLGYLIGIGTTKDLAKRMVALAIKAKEAGQ